MSAMLVICGLAACAIRGVSFGGVDSNIPNMIIPRFGKFLVKISCGCMGYIPLDKLMGQDYRR